MQCITRCANERRLALTCKSFMQPSVYSASANACCTTWQIYSPFQGRIATGVYGVYIGLYILPKSGHVNFLWGNNDVKMVTEHFIPPKKTFIPPQNKFLATPLVRLLENVSSRDALVVKKAKRENDKSLLR